MHKYIGLSSNIQRELNLHELNTYVYMYNTNLLKTISNIGKANQDIQHFLYEKEKGKTICFYISGMRFQDNSLHRWNIKQLAFGETDECYA